MTGRAAVVRTTSGVALKAKAKLDAGRMFAQGPAAFLLARRVQEERLTFLPRVALMDLWNLTRELQASNVEGAILEAGCALGGSALMLAAAKEPSRPLHIFDVFGMIPAPSEKDGEDVHQRYAIIASGNAKGFRGDTYYGYQGELRDKVEATFVRFGYPLGENNIVLVQGLFQDTIRPEGPVALGHIDGDWYESVKVCLERMWPALSPGGVLVIDDYDGWSGCRKAVNEWVTGREDVLLERRHRLHLRKRS
jgi:hypothetical protein